MARTSLSVKHRPKTFDDLTEQGSIKDILTNQIETKTFQHGYLFTGPAGCGKTTSARIFANMINEGKGTPIEVDAASNSGVDNIRRIIDDSKKKPLDAEYKIFIIDECHSLSNGAWQAMLKLLEEPPKFSIFILATTDPQKIPATILSRVQRFQFNKISNQGIVDRLKTICDIENKDIVEEYGDMDSASDIEWAREQNLPIFDYDIDALEFIAKTASGGMRDAITLMDKCLSLSNELTLENVLKTIGSESYETFFEFLNRLCNKGKHSITVIENVFNEGKDVKQFMKEFGKFILDVEKYLIYESTEYINIPATQENINQLKELELLRNEVFDVMELVVNINNKIKWDSDPKTLIELEILLYCGKED